MTTLFSEVQEFLSLIRSKNAVTSSESKKLVSLFNLDLKTLVDTKRQEILDIVNNDKSITGFFQVDVAVPFNIRLHTFNSALKKYEKAEKSFDIYQILTSELFNLQPLVEEISLIKDNKIEEVNKQFPLEENILGDVVKTADAIIDNVREKLSELCEQQAINMAKRFPDRYSNIEELSQQLFKDEIERIRSVVVCKFAALDPADVVNIKFRIGYDGCEGEWVITEKNGQRWSFEFRSIFAGGYFIQCFHTRTIVYLTKL